MRFSIFAIFDVVETLALDWEDHVGDLEFERGAQQTYAIVTRYLFTC